MNEDYRIVKEENISSKHLGRIVVKVLLNERVYAVDEMEKISQEIVEYINQKYIIGSINVIYICFAFNTNFIRRNLYWFRAQWVSNKINEKHYPSLISDNKYENGIYYIENSMYDTMAEFENNNKKDKSTALKIINKILDETEVIINDIEAIIYKLNKEISTFENIINDFKSTRKRVEYLCEYGDILYSEELEYLDRTYEELISNLNVLFLIFSRGTKNYGDSNFALTWIKDNTMEIKRNCDDLRILLK